MPKWQKISSKTVHENPWWSVEEHDVIRPDGTPGKYFIALRPSFCSVLAITPGSEIFLVKQFRYPTGTEGWETPQGLNDDPSKSEDDLASAQRELREETGLSASSWVELGSGIQAEKGFTNSMAHIYIARELRQSTLNQQAEEGISDCQPFSYGQIKDMIRRGDIHDDITITSVYLAELHGHLS